MKRAQFILVLCLVFISSAVSASLATDVEKKYDTISTWKASFTQTTFVEMLKQTLSKTGEIAVKRPQKLNIKYTSKPNKIYVSDGKKLWVYKESENTAWQFDKLNRMISEEALSFLSGLNRLSELFDVMTDLKEPEGYLKIKDRALKRISLVPKKQDAVLRITLGVDAKTLLIKEAVLFNTSGNVTHYQFSGIDVDTKIEDSFFTLPKEPKRKIVKK